MDTEKAKVEKIDDSNIFSDFSTNKELQSDVDNFKKNQKKDIYDILSVFSSIFRILSILLTLILLFGFGYIYAQKNAGLSSSSILDPICYFVLGDDELKPNGECSSVSYASEFYKKSIEDTKISQFKSIFSLVGDLYRFKNFFNSKEVLFLKDNTNKRLKPSVILNDLTTLISDFNQNKNYIACYNIAIGNINLETALSADCIAYSGLWESDLSGYDGTKNKYFGSSISISNSFLNYINEKGDNFELLDKQKDFSLETETGSLNGVTKFNLKLKYIPDNL